jgi:hypothetical protein
MKHGRRLAIILAAAACLLVCGALGGGLLNAGAAPSKSSSTATNGQPQGSNEDPAHEKGESAAREAAEDNGTATFGHHGDCHHGRPELWGDAEHPGDIAAWSSALGTLPARRPERRSGRPARCADQRQTRTAPDLDGSYRGREPPTEEEQR